jgi:hypothetical protein
MKLKWAPPALARELTFICDHPNVGLSKCHPRCLGQGATQDVRRRYAHPLEAHRPAHV